MDITGENPAETSANHPEANRLPVLTAKGVPGETTERTVRVRGANLGAVGQVGQF